MRHNVVMEPLRPIDASSLIPSHVKNKLDRALILIADKLKNNIQLFGEQFPGTNCEGGIWPLTENIDWTTSFWSGQLWLAWQMTGEPLFKQTAQRQVFSFARRIEQKIDTDTHDLGFLYTLSCVSAWDLTADTCARMSALQAADALLTRYHPVARIIQAWGDLSDPQQQGRMIIDCNMNLPLLYWASQQTGDSRYAQAAQAHAAQAARYLVRPDASTYHTYYFDVNNGEPRFGDTHQGFSDDSCWARGQAWGIYGFMLSYRHTGDREYLTLAQSLAHYFLNRLPEDGVCYWDLSLTTTDTCRDSSAAAIAVCGLLSLAEALPLLDEYRVRYEQAALTIMESLTDYYLATPEDSCQGLLKHAVYHMPKGKGVDECCSWGDYYYLEALARLRQSWVSWW